MIIDTHTVWMIVAGREGVVLTATSHSFPSKSKGKGKEISAERKKKKKKMGAENFSMQLIASQKSRYTSNRRYAIRIQKKRRNRKREERQGGTKESHSGMIVKSYPRARFVEAFPDEDP